MSRKMPQYHSNMSLWIQQHTLLEPFRPDSLQLRKIATVWPMLDALQVQLAVGAPIEAC